MLGDNDKVCEARNSMAYASQMQFEVLRRALWAQQAQPHIVFDRKFWEQAAKYPKMTTYLHLMHQGVKVKMCETTPFVNTIGTQYVAACAKIEHACDSIRAQRQSLNTYIGIAQGEVNGVSEGRW